LMSRGVDNRDHTLTARCKRLAFRFERRKGTSRIDDLATDQGHQRLDLCDANKRNVEIIVVEDRKVRQHPPNQPAAPVFIMSEPGAAFRIKAKRLFAARGAP